MYSNHPNTNNVPMPFMLNPRQTVQETPQPQVQTQPQQKRQNNDSKNPKHTVFLYSISYTQPENDIRDYVSSFGDINNFYSQIPSKGSVFVTFYDIRSAQRLVEDAKNKTLGDRAVHANYAFKNHTPKHDRWETCANVQLKGMVPTKLTELDIQQAMSQFGEIRSTEPVPPNPFNILFKVKYYDIRHAHNAMRNPFITIKDEHFQLEYFPDEDEETPDNTMNAATPIVSNNLYNTNQLLGSMQMSNMNNKFSPIVPANSAFPPANYGNMPNMPNQPQLNMFNLTQPTQPSNSMPATSNPVPSAANLESLRNILKILK